MSSKKQTSSKETAPASRARRHFDAIAPGFHAANALAKEWRQAESEARELFRRELGPLQDAYSARLKQLVVMLDGQYMDPALDEQERIILSTYLADVALGLLDEGDDPELDEIVDKHEAILEDDEESHAMTPLEFQRFVMDTYGEEIDDDIVPGSPEAVRLLSFLKEEKAEYDAVKLRRMEAKLAKVEVEGNLHEAQLEEMLDELGRELGDASSAGADLGELAQRIVPAIAERNLGQLVELRLALEARGALPHFPEKQLTLCHKLLKEETRLLGLEIDLFESELLDELTGPVPAQIVPALLLQDMRSHVEEMRELVATHERELTDLRDVQQLKAWLRKVDQPGEPGAA